MDFSELSLVSARLEFVILLVSTGQGQLNLIKTKCNPPAAITEHLIHKVPCKPVFLDL